MQVGDFFTNSDFSINPKDDPIPVGQSVTFRSKLAPSQIQLELIWYVDGKEIPDRSEITHVFTSRGTYSVRLFVRDRITGKNDSIAKNIHVQDLPELEVAIGFSPETSVYEIGATVGFIAKTKNDKGITEHRWYVNGEYIGSGPTGVKHKFTEARTYEVKLGLRMGSNFDEVKTARTLNVWKVGSAGIGTLGRWRNRFEASVAPENLVIRSSYWIGGAGKWSKPATFNGSSIGPVESYILYTGEQADGYNTGYLVYVPRNGKRLQFKVFHFRWPKNPKIGPMPHGIVHYSGPLPLHSGKTPIPDSICFVRKASRLCDVEWRTEDGSSCRVRISKFKQSNNIRYSGVDDLGCKKGVAETEKDDLPRVLLKTNRGDITVKLFEDEAPNTVANFISLVEQDFYDGLKFHRVIADFMIQGGCPKGNGTGGPGYTFEDEFHADLKHDGPGILTMANSGPNTNGSQFVIMLNPCPSLDGRHTVFGQIVEGMDVVPSIRKGDTIIEAKVLRKRPHKYVPKKMGR